MRSGVSVRASFVLAACCLVAIPAYAQATSPSELVTVFAKRNVGKAGVGIAIASYDRGAIDIAVAPPLSRTTVVEIGSVSKTFTALLLADMVGRHEVALDDPIEQFLPAGLNAPVRGGKHITLLDLATQSSGLPPLPTNFLPQKRIRLVHTTPIPKKVSTTFSHTTRSFATSVRSTSTPISALDCSVKS